MSAAKVVTSARPHDFVYDPVFVVSGPKDHARAAIIASISTAKYQVCPIFPNMFSDLARKPRNQMVRRRSEYFENYLRYRLQAEETQPTTKIPDIIGADRFKFFARPTSGATKKGIPNLQLSSARKSFRPDLKSERTDSQRKKQLKMQTQFRESSAQTSPWQPDYFVTDEEGTPEILKLDFLKWGSGLPAGMHEVRLIERARMKRQWEQVMPPITGPESIKKRGAIIAAMERDEWAFREQEIQDIQDLRMELLEQMLKELHEKTKNRTEAKMKMFCEMKQREKEQKLAKLRHEKDRELRKLKLKQLGIERRYKKMNIIEEHANRTSELYAPLIRHGVDPKRSHQVIDEHLKKYTAQFIGVENFSTLPRWLEEIKARKTGPPKKLPGTRLCIRETKWTAPVLRQLHNELKYLRNATKRRCSLRTEIEREDSALETPEMDEDDDKDDEVFEQTLMVQNVLRGRATQMLIFEGRDQCRELIQELKSTHSLQENEKIKTKAKTLQMIQKRRDEQISYRNNQMLHTALDRLQGAVVGSLLDFLNKELRRLLDERKAHAMCLLFERERTKREAAEAGRRQEELQRRKEHDEMFKQIIKVKQDTIDLYLQDIITEGMNFTTEQEAQNYVRVLNDKIDKEIEETKEILEDLIEKEELVADLLHHFLLPEIEKELVRDRNRIKREKYLKVAHDEIYKKIEGLPEPPPPPPLEELLELRKPPVWGEAAEEQNESPEDSVEHENSEEQEEEGARSQMSLPKNSIEESSDKTEASRAITDE